VIQEALLLLETRAGPVLRDMLDEPDLSDSLRWVVWRPSDGSAWRTWPATSPRP
jgi:hypothetical protein